MHAQQKITVCINFDGKASLLQQTYFFPSLLVLAWQVLRVHCVLAVRKTWLFAASLGGNLEVIPGLQTRRPEQMSWPCGGSFAKPVIYVRLATAMRLC